MPSSNQFQTCRVNVSKIPLSMKVNCYAINNIRSLYLNCPMIQMCSGPMRPLREGEGNREDQCSLKAEQGQSAVFSPCEARKSYKMRQNMRVLPAHQGVSSSFLSNLSDQ